MVPLSVRNDAACNEGSRVHAWADGAPVSAECCGAYSESFRVCVWAVFGAFCGLRDGAARGRREPLSALAGGA